MFETGSSAIAMNMVQIPTLASYIGQPLDEIEKFFILETLRQQSFNRTKTAKVLKIGIRTLQRKLKQYGMPLGNSGIKLSC